MDTTPSRNRISPRTRPADHLNLDYQAENDRMRFENRLARALFTNLCRPDALNRVLEVIVALPGIQSGCFHIFDQKTGRLDLVSHIGLPAPFLAILACFEPESPLIERVGAGADRVWFGDLSLLLPETTTTPKTEDLSGAGVIPIWHNCGPVAALSVFCAEHGRIPATTRSALKSAAELLGGFLADVGRKSAKIGGDRKYRNIFENIQDVYYEVTLDGELLEISPSIQEVSGFSRKELIGRSLYSFYADAREREVFIAELIEKKRLTDHELKLKDKHGEVRVCSVTAKLVTDEQDRPLLVIGSLRDITARKCMEDALRESEKQKNAILDASLDWIRHIDRDMRILWYNKTTANALQLPSHKVMGRPCHEILCGRRRPCDGCPTIKAMQSGRTEKAVMRFDHFRGVAEESFWESYSVPLKNRSGQIVSFIQISKNITDQVNAEKIIRTLTQEQLKAQENERLKISRYLHDQVAQDLSSLKIGCETMFDRNSDIPQNIRRRLSEMSALLQSTIAAVRDLSYDLRPPGMEHLGLARTLMQYCQEFSKKHNLRIDCFSAGMDDLDIDYETEINLFRIAQEALNNVNRHARATRVSVRLVSSWPSIILRIEDNGDGFQVARSLVEAAAQRHMGLSNMRERVRLLHGKLNIRSRPGKGTKIIAEIPHQEKDLPDEKKHSDR